MIKKKKMENEWNLVGEIQLDINTNVFTKVIILTNIFFLEFDENHHIVSDQFILSLTK